MSPHLPIVARDEESAEPPASDVEWGFARLMLRLFFGVFHAARSRGVQNIPPKGPLIIAPNHQSYYDPPLIGMVCPRKLRFMAWGALFGGGWFERLIRRFGAYPVNTDAPDAASYKTTMRILQNGGAMVLFPEGERTPTGDLIEFEPGLARMAIRTGATIVPASIEGACHVWPRWRKRPRPYGRILIKFHPPIHVPRRRMGGEELDRAIAELNERIRRPIERRHRAYASLLTRAGRALPRPQPETEG